MGEELFSGWAPDAPVDDTLLRRFVFALADRTTFLADRLGAATLDSDALAAIDAQSAVTFDNYAVLLQPPTMFDVETTIAEATAFFPEGRPFVIMSAWPLGDLRSFGLELMGHPPFMFRPAGDPPEELPRPPGLRIEEVTTDVDLTTFVTTLIEAYPMPGGDTGIFDRRMLGGPIRLFVGYEGDRPVATAGTIVSHGLNDVEWVSVRDDCRGRGYGEAMTWTATTADPSLPGVLIASDLGFGVYRRLGYESLLRFTLWYG